MKHLRPFLILLLSILAVVAARGLRAPEMFSRAADSDKNPSYEDYTDDYKKIVSKYHEETNKLFNERIAKLVQVANDGAKEDLAKLVKFVTPPGLKKNSTGDLVPRLPCPGDNLSTYCLAQAAADNYLKFRASMIKARDRKKEGVIEDLFSEPALRKNINDAREAANSYEETLNAINAELSLARDSMDQALTAYDELQMALPMHMKYLEMIGALEDYRDKVSKVRREVNSYPGTFLDVSTTSCK